MNACPACGGRRTESRYWGVIVHPYGQLKIDGELDIYDDFPPGGMFYGGSAHGQCRICKGTGATP